MRIGHLEIVRPDGTVKKVHPIRSTDNHASDDSERRRQMNLARWLYLDRMNEAGHVLKLYDGQGRLIDIVDSGCSIGRSISLRV